VRHYPAFEELAAMAAQHKVRVLLGVSDVVLFADRAGQQRRRMLSSVELRGVNGKVLAATPVYDEDLEAAARDLLARVG